MSRALRTASMLGVVALGVASAAGDARGDGAATGTALTTLSSLPSGTMTLPPKAKAPSSIPAREKVAGFHLVRGGGSRGDFGYIVSNVKVAKQITEGTRDEGMFSGAGCFTEDLPGMRRTGEADPEWRADLEPMLRMGLSGQGGPRPSVTAVHSERLAEDAGKTSLEVIDAWVDPVTRGARLIGRSTVPLVLVSTFFGGAKLFAARDSQSIHVVLVTPKVNKFIGQRGVFAVANDTVISSSCNHIRSTLKIEKGQGQGATLVSSVELPSLDTGSSEVESPSPSPSDAPNPRRGLRRGMSAAEGRSRPMHVNASVSWPSREKEALLSVSAGWDSREQTGIVF